MEMIVGSYTHLDSKALYLFKLDMTQKNSKLLASYEDIENPTYVIKGHDNQLYSVSETTDGKVVCLEYDGTKGFTQIAESRCEGDDPCHLALVDEYVVVGNYTSGDFSLIHNNSVHQLSFHDRIKHIGSSKNELRQDCPHVHQICKLHKKNHFAVVDLGIDAILFYELNQGEVSVLGRLDVEKGSGPRHMVLHPVLPNIYVVNELSSSVAVYGYSPDFSEFECIQTITTIPETYEMNNQCAAIDISQDGRHLYITNRGHDSIVVYTIANDDGQLQRLQRIGCYGQWPRDGKLSACQNYYLVANEHSHEVVIFINDKETGILSYHFSVKVSEPTCVFTNI